MARNVDLTDKLGMAGKPTITIGETVLTVNNSARDALRLMALIGEDGLSPADTDEAVSILFDAKSKKALDALELDFSDYSKVMEAALGLLTGAAEGEGETQATT